MIVVKTLREANDSPSVMSSKLLIKEDSLGKFKMHTLILEERSQNPENKLEACGSPHRTFKLEVNQV